MNEEKTITVDGIEATVVRKRVKNVRVSILPPDGTVRVTAPKLFPEAMIRLFLSQKASWIRANVEKIKKSHAHETRQYESGETLRLFGQVYPLCVLENQKKNGVALDGGRVVLSLKGEPSKEKREAILNEWLRERLKSEIEHYCRFGRSIPD